jgi:hypothetical protein
MRGELAKRLGLSGKVEKAAFDRLSDGLDPHREPDRGTIPTGEAARGEVDRIPAGR